MVVVSLILVLRRNIRVFHKAHGVPIAIGMGTSMFTTKTTVINLEYTTSHYEHEDIFILTNFVLFVFSAILFSVGLLPEIMLK